MKSISEVEDRLRAVLVAELERRLSREVLPHLCVNNHRQPLDHRKRVYGEPNPTYNQISAGVEDHVSLPVVQTIGLCLLGAEDPASWPGTICEEPIDAQRCPHFAYRQKRSEVYEQFAANLQDPAWVEHSLPEAQALLWVLGGSLNARAGGSTGHQLWAWLRKIFASGSEKSVGVAVYLPPLDAFPDQERPRAVAHH